MALTRVWIPSPNYSSRGGANVRLIVLHTAEGATTYQNLGAFFASPSSGVSSHVGIDDTPGVIGEYVRPPMKAWTAVNANPVAVQAEMCAFAEWSPDQWRKHPEMLKNAARWVAEEAARFGIPIVKLTPTQAQTSGSGVCQHVDLGQWGGGHWDCGPGFPMDGVIAMARGGTVEGPKPPPAGEDECPMVIATNKAGGQWLIWGSFRTAIANPTESQAYQAAGAKKVDWSEEMIQKFPIAQNVVK